jgi:transposase-like protein
MRGHGAKLPRKQEAAVTALLYNRTVEEAAKSIDVNPNTLRRWMELPEFEEAYLKARREAVRQADARLQQNSAAAGSVLLKLMADSTIKASTRVQAAKCILEIAGKSLETDDMLMRLARLEESEQKRGRK